MPNLKVTLWEKYHYNVTVPENPSLRDIAMAISLEVHRQEHKTKFTGVPRTFPYILKCLQKTADFNFRVNLKGETKDRIKEAFDSANYLNSMSKPKVINCPVCNGNKLIDANVPFPNEHLKTCPKCNGHGKIVERITYRVGDTFNNQLVIDIDNKDLNNVKDVKEFYEKLLGEKFRVFHTTMGKGVWLFGSKRYDTVEEFIFAHCLVLNPHLMND